VENHLKLVVLLQEAKGTLLAQHLALDTEFFPDPQGICSGDQESSMSFYFIFLGSDGTDISKLENIARHQLEEVRVNWKK
jgi:hypothetical protein